jgi:hypothetical protein
VALGRSVVARVKIRELFDEVSSSIMLYRVERMLISSLSKTGNLRSTTTSSYPDVSYLWIINETLSS